MKKEKLVIKKVRPMFTRIFTTANKYTFEDSISDTGIIAANVEGSIKDIQTVVAVGEGVRGIKVGDLVSLNFARYAQHKYAKDSTKSDMNEFYNDVVSYAFTFVNIDNQDCLFLDSSDVEFVIDEYTKEEVELPETLTKEKPKGSKLVKPNTTLIV